MYVCMYVYPLNPYQTREKAQSEMEELQSRSHVPLLLLLLLLLSSSSTLPVIRCATLFLFGDSLCDTGNGPFVNHRRATSLPFGMTFPGYAIGRFSDGRDIVPDFLGTTTLNLRQRQRQRQRQICLA